MIDIQTFVAGYVVATSVLFTAAVLSIPVFAWFDRNNTYTADYYPSATISKLKNPAEYAWLKTAQLYYLVKDVAKKENPEITDHELKMLWREISAKRIA